MIIGAGAASGGVMDASNLLKPMLARGELRAVGDIGIDQLSNLRRCGFDAIAPEHELNAEDAHAALARWPHAYQATGDGQTPIWALRHSLGRHGAKA